MVGTQAALPPEQLRAIPRWILWRWARRGSDLVKVPTRPTGDGNISAFDPAGWMAFNDAAERLRIAEANNTWGSGGGGGFVFDGSDGLGGVDLDGVLCPETGQLAGWAREVVDRFASFTEISPSGTGLHIYALGAPEVLGRTSVAMPRGENDPVIVGKPPLLEAFVSGRFFTFTGNRLKGTPADVRAAPEAWKWLAEKLGAHSEQAERPKHDYPDVELKTVADALRWFSSDDVDRNTFVGFAYVLRHQFGEDARDLYADWMARSPNDGAEATQAIWDNAHGEPRSMTLGSIFHHAMKHGWTPPWRVNEPELLFDDPAPSDPLTFVHTTALNRSTEMATTTEAETDEFAWLFEVKADKRAELVKNIALLAQLKHHHPVRYQELMDALGPKRKPKKRVTKLRDLDRDVDKYIRQAKEAAATKAQSKQSERDGFDRDENGKLLASQANIRLAIEKLGARLRYDEFRGMPMVEGLEGYGPALDDHAVNHLWLRVEEEFGFRPSLQYFQIVAADACQRERFHPVCDYLDSLEWDGKKRIGSWLTRYLGAEEAPFVSAVGRLILIAAVRRVRTPGTKFDEALILESAEGHGKSSALALMAVNEDWFSDSVALNVDDKRMIEGLSGKWIAELAELQGMRKGDVGRIKAQLSRSRDRARLAYGRLPIEVPRQAVFFGTVNPDPTKAAGYLASLTGNRRFWPVEVGKIDLKALAKDRDQLWAEASVLEARGISIRLDSSLWGDAEREQEARQAPNPLTEIFAKYLSGREGVLFSADAWELTGISAAQRAGHYDKFGAALRSLGWIRRKRRRHPGAEQEWAYVKGDERKRIVPKWDKMDRRMVIVEESFGKGSREADDTKVSPERLEALQREFDTITEDDEDA